MELLEKLAALVPPPRLHLVRYHGVLGPHATDRQHHRPPASPVHKAPLRLRPSNHTRKEGGVLLGVYAFYLVGLFLLSK